MTGSPLLSLIAGLGALLAALTFAVLRAEKVAPDPAQIQVRDGLGQMLAGALAWAAAFGAIAVLIVSGGAVITLIALVLILAAPRLPLPPALLQQLYGARLILAFAALLCTVLSLLILLSSLGGATHV